ncbi:non-capsid protein NS-1 [Clonorchis sinensis]|uniref:Non-capsid protein NS-1 n=1 Tax=Clonorchis sinensis TaxID=79923 RepID=G7YYC5_CLOSI|nr:non-capsid protein NS-1 [Clonorchis sinensis]
MAGSPVFEGTQPSPTLSFNHWVEHQNAQPPSPDLFSDSAVDEEFWTSHQPNPGETDTVPIVETPPQQYRPPMLDLSNVWHSKRRQLFADESSQENNKLWTFVYRGTPPRFDRNTRANCLYVDHGDHYHFVFECCPQNKTRTIQRLIESRNLDRRQSMSIMSTVQPVINWNNFAAYLVRAAQTPIVCIGKKLEHLRDDLYMIPRERKDCATLMRDERGARQKMANITRKRRLDLLRNLVETYDARSFNELNLALTYDERDDIYGEYGPQWKETAEHCIQNYTMRILVEQQTSRFEDHIRTNSHNRDCQHPKDTLDGEDWLDRLLFVNRINKQKFLADLTRVMNKQVDRKNAFVLEGPTTTGKTLFVKLIADNYIYGTVQRSGDHSQFFLMNLLNKALALMEEPRITQLTVNDLKELLGGNAFDIHVKHQKDERLTRLPVRITTNNDLTYYVLGEDGKVIKERCFYYKFFVKVGSEELPLPPCKLCTCHFRNWYFKSL